MPDHHAPITGKYSLMTKALFAVALPMLATFAVLSFWWAVFDSQRLPQAVIHVLMGAFFAWMLLASLKVVRFFRCEIQVSDEGLRLRWPSEDKTYPWRGLRSYRDRQALQLVEVYDHDGSRILLFDYHLFPASCVALLSAHIVALPEPADGGWSVGVGG